jgi:UDP-N-acetylglucosamine 4,6-dehydratase
MSRFWITIEQAVYFIIDSVARMRGGEIFIPKIPSLKIIDLTKAIAPNAKQIITGIRPGEKLHEVLLSTEEARHTKEFRTSFVVEPEHPFWEKTNFLGGKLLPEGFTYASNNNDKWLTEKQIKKILKKLNYEK